MNNYNDYKEWEIIMVGSANTFITQLLYDKEVTPRTMKQYEAKYGSIYHSNNQAEFFKELDRFNKIKYCYGWKEITEERYWEMLEVLPPEKYTNFKGWNIFRMSEYMTWGITTHFMGLDWKFYEGSFDTVEYKNILDTKDLNYEIK